jgi:hypothetical protein
MGVNIMASVNPRINVTFETATADLITLMAHKQHRSVASVVRELAIEALELREDLYLSDLAKKLDKPGVKTYSHNVAWK